jgi:predicted ester cyclase
VGDRVLTRVTVRGTFAGAFLGFPPTGRVIEVGGVTVHRVAGGKLVEHWAHIDMNAFVEQIGAALEPD